MFLVTEVFITGFGFFGILSFICIVTSFYTVLTYLTHGIVIACIEIIILGLIGFFLFRFIRKRKLFGKVILTENLSDNNIKMDFEKYVGKVGVSKTMLKPSGLVKFDDVTLEVYSQIGLIPPNTKVIVIESINNRLFVDRLKNEEE